MSNEAERGLTERLRARRNATKWARGMDTDYATTWEPDLLCLEAADEIERLQREICRLQEAEAAAMALIMSHEAMIERLQSATGSAIEQAERPVAWWHPELRDFALTTPDEPGWMALYAAPQPAPAPQAQPVAWIVPGENANTRGFIDAMAWKEGEFTCPVYAAAGAQDERERCVAILDSLPTPASYTGVQYEQFLAWTAAARRRMLGDAPSSAPAPQAAGREAEDAARYRFIRDADKSDDLIPEIGLYAMESLDEYVDAAMAEYAAVHGIGAQQEPKA